MRSYNKELKSHYSLRRDIWLIITSPHNSFITSLHNSFITSHNRNKYENSNFINSFNVLCCFSSGTRNNRRL